jgi:glycosyltransferase involved in cell wall biosynthesis
LPENDVIGSAPASSRSAAIVTVAVPSYNQGRFLDATLRSILAQSVPIEVMLADAGSTDDTQHVIARWQHRFGGVALRIVVKRRASMRQSNEAGHHSSVG